jgi:hypothetical protein
MKTAPFFIALDNLNARDAQFLGGVIKFFCDPLYSDLADQIRRGQAAIQYGPKTGLASTMPVVEMGRTLTPTLQPTPRPLTAN